MSHRARPGSTPDTGGELEYSMPVHPFLDHPRPYAIAHRGGALDGIENTMAAFRRACDLGYTYLETDVRVTADGELVVFHDATVDRVTDGTGRVGDLTWAELSRLEVGGREPVPRFADVLTALPGARFIVDPKCDDAVDPLIRVLADLDAVARVCVGSFSDARLQRVRRAFGPALCTSMGPREVARLRLAAWNALPSSAVPRAAACVQMPLRYWLVRVAEPRVVDLAHRLDLQVQVWTVNDATTMHDLLDIGVDAVMTDDVATLRDVLRTRGQWHGG